MSDATHENDLRLLGLTIAYYRKAAGYTQESFADALNVSRTHISNIEAPNERTSISLRKLYDIADLLGMNIRDLFDYRSAKYEKKQG